MKNLADHYRYLHEISPADEYKKAAKTSYNDAVTECKNCKLPKTDQVYLTLNLNYMVFVHDVLKMKDSAIKIGKMVLNTTLKETQEITENYQKDIILICQMIKDNLALWENQIN